MMEVYEQGDTLDDGCFDIIRDWTTTFSPVLCVRFRAD